MVGNSKKIFSKTVLEILEIDSKVIASSVNREYVQPQDIIFCIIENKNKKVQEMLDFLHVDKEKIAIELSSVEIENANTKKNKEIIVSKSVDYIIDMSWKMAKKFNHKNLDCVHILLYISLYNGSSKIISCVQNICKRYGIVPKKIHHYIEKKYDIENCNKIKKDCFNKQLSDMELLKKRKNTKYDKLKIDLIKSGLLVDVGKKVKNNNKDVFVGREKEIKRSIQILCRKKKKNLIILGESGVGKSFLIEGILKKIIRKEVPERLIGTEIYSLDMGNLISGAKYRGQFEERMKSVITFAEMFSKENKNVVLFIDDINLICDTGSASENSVNGSSMLKSHLDSNEIQCIGTTTFDNYNKYIVKDSGLHRCFSTISLEEPPYEDMFDIMKEIKKEYEKFHNIKVSDSIINSIIDLSDKYIKDRCFPDKAIDILDEVCSLGSLNEDKTVPIGYVLKVLSDSTGIPITTLSKNEREFLLKLESELKKDIIGQDKALKQLSEAIKRSRVGLKDPDKPIGVFLFLGPTGTGKTLAVKKLSEKLFGNNKIIRLDMSEYMDKYSVSKITGSPPGYVGYDEGSQIAKLIRKKPYSVILLDEIEKAHPDVLNVFLQIFDEGQMTDSHGRLIDFRNTIIIMTSNLATNKIKKQTKMGFKSDGQTNMEEIEDFLMKEVKRFFSPEFVNRFDSTIVFKKLSKQNASDIFDIEFEKTIKKVKKMGYVIEINEKAKEYLCKKGYSEQYGARPMTRTIQQKVEIPLADKILSEDLDKNKKILVSCEKEKILIKVS